MWIWLTLEVENTVCWASSFCQQYRSKLCIVTVFGFCVVPLCRDWSSNADRLCVLSAATQLCILPSFRIQLQLFSLIALNCGLHLSDKWKWLIIWPFVFLRKQWCTDFKHCRIIRSGVWRESVVEKLLWWFWKGPMCWYCYCIINVLFYFQYNVTCKINITWWIQLVRWWKWRVSICDTKHM